MERTRWRAGGAPPPDQVRARSRQRDSPRARIRRPPPSQALQRGVEPPPSGLPGYPVGRLCNSAASRAREEMKSRRDPASHAWIWAQARATNYSARPRSARPLSAKRSRARDSAAVAAISLQAGWGSACAFTRLRKPGSSASRSPTGALLPMQPVASAGRRPAAASRPLGKRPACRSGSSGCASHRPVRSETSAMVRMRSGRRPRGSLRKSGNPAALSNRWQTLQFSGGCSDQAPSRDRLWSPIWASGEASRSAATARRFTANEAFGRPVRGAS
jgi:hypothetical protein